MSTRAYLDVALGVALWLAMGTMARWVCQGLGLQPRRRSRTLGQVTRRPR